MTEALEGAPLTQVLQVLWRGKSTVASRFQADRGRSSQDDDTNCLFVNEMPLGILMPPTVVFEHNFPKGLFTTNMRTRMMSRRAGREADSSACFEALVAFDGQDDRRATDDTATLLQAAATTEARLPGRHAHAAGNEGDILTMYIEEEQEHDPEPPGEDPATFGRRRIRTHFFTEAGLRTFLLSSPNKKLSRDTPEMADAFTTNIKSGLLQRFVYPMGRSNDMIQVTWSPTMFFVEKRRSHAILGDLSLTPFQRGATFEAPDAFSSKSFVSPQLFEQLRDVTDNLIGHIAAIERRDVSSAVFYFKSDAHARLWFLFCPHIAFVTPVVRVAHPERPLSARGRAQWRGSDVTKDLKGITPLFLIPQTIFPVKFLEPFQGENQHRENTPRLRIVTSDREYVGEDEVLTSAPRLRFPGMPLPRTQNRTKNSHSNDEPYYYRSDVPAFPEMDFSSSRGKFILPSASRLCKGRSRRKAAARPNLEKNSILPLEDVTAIAKNTPSDLQHSLTPSKAVRAVFSMEEADALLSDLPSPHVSQTLRPGTARDERQERHAVVRVHKAITASQKALLGLQQSTSKWARPRTCNMDAVYPQEIVMCLTSAFAPESILVLQELAEPIPRPRDADVDILQFVTEAFKLKRSILGAMCFLVGFPDACRARSLPDDRRRDYHFSIPAHPTTGVLCEGAVVEIRRVVAALKALQDGEAPMDLTVSEAHHPPQGSIGDDMLPNTHVADALAALVDNAVGASAAATACDARAGLCEFPVDPFTFHWLPGYVRPVYTVQSAPSLIMSIRSRSAEFLSITLRSLHQDGMASILQNPPRTGPSVHALNTLTTDPKTSHDIPHAGEIPSIQESM